MYTKVNAGPYAAGTLLDICDGPDSCLARISELFGGDPVVMNSGEGDSFFFVSTKLEVVVANCCRKEVYSKNNEHEN